MLSVRVGGGGGCALGARSAHAAPHLVPASRSSTALCHARATSTRSLDLRAGERPCTAAAAVDARRGCGVGCCEPESARSRTAGGEAPRDGRPLPGLLTRSSSSLLLAPESVPPAVRPGGGASVASVSSSMAARSSRARTRAADIAMRSESRVSGMPVSSPAVAVAASAASSSCTIAERCPASASSSSSTRDICAASASGTGRAGAGAPPSAAASAAPTSMPYCAAAAARGGLRAGVAPGSAPEPAPTPLLAATSAASVGVSRRSCDGDSQAFTSEVRRGRMRRGGLRGGGSAA